MNEYIDRDAFIADKRGRYCEKCERRQGVKNGKKQFIYEIGDAPCRACDVDDMLNNVEDFPVADVRENGEAELLPFETGYYECSRCHHRIKWEASKIENIKFCWNCGACLQTNLTTSVFQPKPCQ